MSDFQIVLNWWRNVDGYRLVDPPKVKPPLQKSGLIVKKMEGLSGIVGRDAPPPSQGLAIDAGLRGSDLSEYLSRLAQLLYDPSPMLQPVSAKRARYQPLAKYPTLYQTFANSVRDHQSAANFVTRFGPLTKAGFKRGESVTLAVAMAQAMNQWLVAYSNGALDRKFGASEVPVGKITAILVINPITGRPEIQLKADSLIYGLWIQLGQALSGRANLRRCRHCGELFEVGPGTGRRLDAKFCRDQHRIDFNSHKRTPQEVANA